MVSENQYLSVFQFNHRMKRFLNNDSNFKQIYIKGEVSGTRISPSKHLYFNLKDSRSSVPCVVYKRIRKSIDFEIKNGMKLLVVANVNVYVPHGKYQLDIIEASEDGLGKLYVKYRQLVEKLDKEGLFDEKFKKELPEFPKRIGVITSREGSVIHDILKTVGKKWPYCEIFLFPSQVQGSSATNQLIRQIKRAESFGLDVMIIARGGGSIEDLWCFNDEKLARLVFECQTPVISAIGHERDNTLCDLVCDVRASTPTMAADFAVNDVEKISNQVNEYHNRLLNFISSSIGDYKKQFNFMLSKNLFRDSSHIYVKKHEDFKKLCTRFEFSSSELVTSRSNMLTKIKSSYVIRHPLKMQVDSSKHKLNELQSRLIKSMNSIIKTNRHNLDKTTKDFKFSSDKLMQSKKYEVTNIKSSYVIQNPLKIQLKQSLTNLISSKQSIVNFTHQNIQSNKNDFNKLTSRFKYSSNELISSKKVMLNKIKLSYVIRNPCKLQLDIVEINLNNEKSNLLDDTSSIIKTNRANLDNIISGFKFSSNKIISNENYRLNMIKSSYAIQNPLRTQLMNANNDLASSKENIVKLTNQKIKSAKNDFNSILNNELFKNPKIILNEKYVNLNKIKDEKIIKNPYLILNEHKQKLTLLKDKLDKQEEILNLQKEKEKQKSMYMKIIIAIVIILIIMLLLIIGGI